MQQKYIEIYSGLNIAYGKFIPEDKNDAGKLQGKNQIIRQPEGLSEQLWTDHLNGATSLGIIPIDENNECRWGCIDIDQYDFNHRENFRNEFHIKPPNQEKPVSHKIFHITIFGGLALIALWIVLSEILK